MKSSWEWLVALVCAVSLSFYTGIKIPANPAVILGLILGFKQAYFEFEGRFERPLPLLTRITFRSIPDVQISRSASEKFGWLQ
jgi:hypothetical protein